MKKTIFPVLVLGTAVMSHAVVVEDFESYAVGNASNASPTWATTEGTYYGAITVDPLDAENQYIAYGGTLTPGSNGDWRDISRSLGNTYVGSVTLTFDIIATSTNVDNAVGLTSTTELDGGAIDWYSDYGPYCRLIQSSLPGTAEFSIRDGSVFRDDLSYLDLNQWYQVRMEIDFDNKLVDFYLDDNLLYAGAAFRNQISKTDTLLIMGAGDSNAGNAGIDNVEIIGDVASLTVQSVSPANGAVGVTNRPVIGATIIEGGSQVDTNNLTLYLNGTSLPMPYTVSKIGTTATVSKAISTPLDPGTVYTGRVIVAGINPVTDPITNTWTFTTAYEPVIHYVDAVSGASGNTTYWTGDTWAEWNPPQDPGNAINGGGDNLWQEEWSGDPGNLFGNGPSTSNSWFEAGREGAEDCPQLRTRVTGLPDGTCRVYAFFWRASGQDMYLGADLAPNPSGGLPVYAAGSNNVSQASASAFVGGNVLVTSADRSLYQVNLGNLQVTGGILDVYIDDVGDGSSVWYDGIGYVSGATGPSIDPDIQYISVDGSTVTLQWKSEGGVTYSILQKSTLTGASWTPVKTGITGSASTTSDSVPMSGGDQEYFQVKGE